MLKVTLEDIMCEHPVTVSEDIDVGSVAHLLLRDRINGVFITDKNDKQKVIGILTTTDLLRLIDTAVEHSGHRMEELKKASQLPVGQVVTRDIVALEKDTPIVKVIALMHNKNIHTLPVYDQGKLVGVVGRHDIINAALA